MAHDERPKILVTGATGTTGRRLVDALAVRAEVVPASRTADQALRFGVRFDWSDPRTYDAALDGVSAAYLVPPTGVADPAAAVIDFVRRARDRGVRRVVLHGAHSIASSDPGLGEAQRALPALVTEWAVLRPSWFMQNLLGDHHHATSLRTRSVLRTAAGNGRVPFVDVEDLTAVGVVALLDASLDREVVVTGPEALTYTDVAEVLSEETGRTVWHDAVDEDALADDLARQLGPEFGRLLAHMDTRIQDGEWSETTDEVLRITGRPPVTLRDFVRRHVAELVVG
ncbi:ergot alkaloid biosynthesis protein [Rhodococcoides kroppenstedtii]|uniref:ergot alkaloid biosynthesis protein n=1 Tax=Rhodococcoides kroppenstedtii TaxID=293050 RepID=UPI001427CDCE|nr:ergot alkaloid biosynthesis protein [Rhodococcus kroppenstedtii]NIL82231.1 NAD(P)H azoreductase [Rhodococcus kroppenstedtii]